VNPLVQQPVYRQRRRSTKSVYVCRFSLAQRTRPKDRSIALLHGTFRPSRSYMGRIRRITRS